MGREQLKDKSDEQLVSYIREGSNEAFDILLSRFKNVIKNTSNVYYMNGADKDDILQEGMIGFFKAVMGYDEKKEASFATFATLCINRQVITAVKANNRDKHRPLNTYISIDDKQDNEYNSFIGVDMNDPEQIALDKERVEDINRQAKEVLSDFEYSVFVEYLKGKDYISIAKIYGKSPKAIDNALYRIKKKVAKVLD